MNKTLSIYKNKKIVVTGATGFKGSWLCFWLHLLKANIVGISLKPEKDSILYRKLSIDKKIKQYFINIQDSKKLDKVIKKEKPDLIIHLAAQSIVSLGYKDPMTTIKTNVIGSLNILESVRKNNIKNLIYITSDKCYLNKDEKAIYLESDRLGGEDLYSASKASAEIVFEAYVKSFFFNNKKINLATARAGNVIGGGDMKEDRIVPDIIKSLIKKNKLTIRNPNAVRPWQHVLEPLHGYLILGNYLMSNKLNNKILPNWNFGPNFKNIKSVNEILTKSLELWGKKKKIVFKNNKKFKEVNFLMLNSNKAKKEISWRPKLNFNDTMKLTVDWYKSFYKKENLETITKKQIEFFLKK
jgi:CDP-glucose 4,6-dehydratase